MIHYHPLDFGGRADLRVADLCDVVRYGGLVPEHLDHIHQAEYRGKGRQAVLGSLAPRPLIGLDVRRHVPVDATEPVGATALLGCAVKRRDWPGRPESQYSEEPEKRRLFVAGLAYLATGRGFSRRNRAGTGCGGALAAFGGDSPSCGIKFV